jgi:biotin synthase
MRVASGARRYCMVCSMRGPGAREISHLVEACERSGLITPRWSFVFRSGSRAKSRPTGRKLAGVGWITITSNTSRRFYPEICTTHNWDDRVLTIENVRAARLSVCCGAIIGMGEADDDVIDLAYTTRRLRADSIPINFLHPIAGTPLEHGARFDAGGLSKSGVLFRLVNPRSEVRAAGGRELNLGTRQAEIFNAVNSIFVNGYLTTAGWGIGATRELIEGAGFEVEMELPPA